ncbi:MAG: PD40 domain-containing protein [Anaerolineae bacterium]|nr:PD40 domain-containing protein [Anaerolineae bacterium]
MYDRSTAWDDYLAHRSLTNDIVRGLEYQKQALDTGFTQVVATQEEMIHALDYGLNQVAEGIDKLRASFDWAMAAVLWNMEIEKAELQAIMEAIQAPLDTRAKELKRRAEKAYRNGWYEEALAGFLESEALNYQDFAVHQALGNIYLCHQQPADLAKAREYYLKAAKYATPESSYYAALGYLHAGFVCYLQGDDEEAIEFSRRATELHADLIEAFYNHAKFAATASQGAVAIASLETAIRADPNYAAKACTDADFCKVEDQVTELMNQLRTEARLETETRWQPLQAEMNAYVPAPQDREMLETMCSQIEASLASNTYLGYLAARRDIEECRIAFDDLHLPDRDRLLAEGKETAESIRSQMEDSVVPEALMDLLTAELGRGDELLKAAQSFAEAEAAWNQVKDCAKRWEIALEGAVLRGQGKSVRGIAFAPDGRTLASWAHGGTIRVQDVIRGKELALLKSHEGHMTDVALSPDGTRIAFGINYMNYVRDLTPERKVTELFSDTLGTCGLTFAPDGSLVEITKGGSVTLWEVGTKAKRAVFSEHQHHTRTVLFSPDGTVMATSSEEGKVGLWDVAGQRLLTILETRSDHVPRIAFDASGRLLASGAGDNAARIWDVASGRLVKELRGHTDWITDLAFSPDGKTLISASADGTLRFWNAPNWLGETELRGHVGSVTDIALSPDGAMLASASADKTVRLWDGQTGRIQRVFKGHEESVSGVTFNPDGTILASYSWDGTIRFWPLAMSKARWEKLQQAIQRYEWRTAGRCEECGAELGMLEKLAKSTRCKQHR